MHMCAMNNENLIWNVLKNLPSIKKKNQTNTNKPKKPKQENKQKKPNTPLHYLITGFTKHIKTLLCRYKD